MQPRIPWTRRIGIVLALLALGGTVVLAGGFGNGGKPNAAASPTHSSAPSLLTARATPAPNGPTPRTAPVIATPASTLTSKKTWTARVTIPSTGIARAALQLRIYRNGKAVMNVAVKKGTSMSVRNIPLKSGVNQIAAAFVSPGGEGPRSNTVTITVDDQPPHIDLTQPQNHAVVNAASVRLTGQTEAGVAIVVSNTTEPHTVNATAGSDGRFSVAIALVLGGNDLEVTATDAVGNVGRVQLTVTRGSGVASAQLALSTKTFRLWQLPATFDVTLLVTDANGLAVDGAAVTFSLSPPGVPTSTYQATTQAGRASWTGVTLAQGVQAGSGLVTARVTLRDGSTIQSTATFTVR